MIFSEASSSPDAWQVRDSLPALTALAETPGIKVVLSAVGGVTELI